MSVKIANWHLISIFIFSVVLSSCGSKSNSDTPVGGIDFSNTNCTPESQWPGIIGGQKVSPSAVDATAAIMLLSELGNTYEICTATAISPNVLITAAHCVKGTTKTYVIFHTDVTCESGFKRAEKSAVAASVEIHPDFYDVKKSYTNPDLALIRLSQPVPAGYPIYKIKQSASDYRDTLKLYGYGTPGSNSNGSGFLRRTDVFRGEYDFEGNAMIFLNNGERGICHGDSGGSILMGTVGAYEVAAINSYVEGPKNDVCSGEAVSVLVEPYMDWILKITTHWNTKLK